MKRIYLTIFLLLSTMVTIAYLYFSKLNRDTNNSEIALYAATAKSGLVFGFQNEKSIVELLGSQDLLQRLLPVKELEALQTIHQKLFSIPEIEMMNSRQMIYLSFLPDEDKGITFLLSTQFTEKQDPEMILNLLKAKQIGVEKMDGFARIKLSDSLSFYMAQKNNLILLSPSFKTISEGLKTADAKSNTEFVDYINSNHKLNKNSLAALYVNYNQLKALASVISKESYAELFPFFDKQDVFGNFSYSFSKSRILFNGSTNISKEHNYLHLFAAKTAPVVSMNTILPAETATYTIYSTGDYATWQKGLHQYFISVNKDSQIRNRIAKINNTYRLDLNRTFPVYFKDQLLTFQLKNGETLGAINLTNGDKLNQLLLDVSTEYSQDIKQLKEPLLLYSYFGDAFTKFNKPYYTIIDNYMVFSNYPSSVQVFLNSYRNDRQLIGDRSYINALNQLSPEAGITYYVNRKHAENAAKKGLFKPMFELYRAEAHLGNFDNFIYQMSNGDKKNFQTNILMSTAEEENESSPSF